MITDCVDYKIELIGGNRLIVQRNRLKHLLCGIVDPNKQQTRSRTGISQVNRPNSHPKPLCGTPESSELVFNNFIQ